MSEVLVRDVAPLVEGIEKRVVGAHRAQHRAARTAGTGDVAGAPGGRLREDDGGDPRTGPDPQTDQAGQNMGGHAAPSGVAGRSELRRAGIGGLPWLVARGSVIAKWSPSGRKAPARTGAFLCLRWSGGLRAVVVEELFDP